MVCSNCGAENPVAKNFCGDCGSVLASVCSFLREDANAPGKRFCSNHRVAAEGKAASVTAASAAAAGAVAERRLVSVLFADLVGFTAASEARDAEETRELLTRYFDTLHGSSIERYGGTVEKFIGDAVMAVWGAPVAHEDDAERAVRAALELVAAVPALDPSGCAGARRAS